MKHILIAVALAMAACSKEKPEDDCRKCILISDKYSLDSSFLKRDTLWQDVVCGAELKKVEAMPVQWFLNCGVEPNIIEHMYYELAN